MNNASDFFTDSSNGDGIKYEFLLITVFRDVIGAFTRSVIFRHVLLEKVQAHSQNWSLCWPKAANFGQSRGSKEHAHTTYVPGHSVILGIEGD